MTSEDDEQRKDRRVNSFGIVFAFIALAALIEYLHYYILPGHLRHESGPISQFSVEKTRQTLTELTKLGPRVTGTSANDYATPEWLLSKLGDIQRAMPADSGLTLEVSFQTPSSSFFIDFLGGINNIYSNVTNVVAKLSPATQSSSLSVLVNAHYDSVPGSPGAADDGVGIAVMLEILRTMSVSPPLSPQARLQKPIVFLFNGAEEWVHHGAQGFMQQHVWARDVGYVINLEAIGSGGREMMFQCNSGYIAHVYQKAAPHPQASVLAHELFKHLLYKVASTDWATFIRYGKSLYGHHVRGFDTAYVDNGYVYHTSFDALDAVPDGTLVNTGENIYSVLYELATTPSADDAQDGNDLSIFFDVLNIFTVAVAGSRIPLLFLCVLGLGALTVVYMLQASRQSVSGLLQGVYLETRLFLSTLLVGAAVGLAAYLLYPMRWYDGGMLVSFLVFLPPLVFYILYTRGVYAEVRPTHTKLLQQLSLLCVWMGLVSLCLLCDIMSGYLGCIWIVCISASIWVYYFCMHYHARHVLQTAGKQGDDVFAQCQTHLHTHASYRTRYNAYYLLCLFPALCMCVKTVNATMVMLIPLLGKTGTVAPADVALGANFALQLALPLGSLLANSTSRRLTKQQISAFSYAILASALVLVFVNRSYSAVHPKRLWLQQVERHYRHVDTTNRWLPPNIQHKKQASSQVVSDYGVWLNGFDERGLDPIMPYVYSYYDAPTSHSMFVESAANSYIVDLYSYLEGLYRSYIRRDLFMETNSDCPFLSSSCYYQFPWYFPVPDALRYGVYLPLHPSPQHTTGVRSAAATPFHSIPVDDKMRLVLQSHALDSAALASAQRALQSCGQFQSSSSHRVLQIDVYGPAHMNVGIKTSGGHADGVVAWWLDDLSVIGRPPGAESNQLTRQLGDVVARMECASRLRGDGLHYFHVGAGRCDLADNSQKSSKVLLCTHRRLYMLTSSAEVEVVAYGHYADMSDDVQVQGLIKALPVWSQGAEWTKFPSVLISDVV